MSKLIELRRPAECLRFPEDVKRLREAINELGFDASDADIQWAYAEFSEKEYCASWLVLELFDPIDKLANKVISYLEVEAK